MKCDDADVSRLSCPSSIYFIALFVCAVFLVIGCSGRQGVGASESWAGVTIQPESNTAFVGTRDGRIIELLLDKDSRNRIVPRQGAVFDVTKRDEGDDRARVDAAFYGTPTVASGRIYVGSYQGFVYSLRGPGTNRDTLGGVGSFEINGDKLSKGITGNIIHSDGKLVVVAAEDTNQGRLYVLDAEELDMNSRQDRIEHCRYPAEGSTSIGRVWTTPLVVEGIAYFGDLNHFVHAVDINNCMSLWDAPVELGGAVVATPVAINGKIYVGAFDRSFYEIDIATGTSVKRFEAGGWFWASPATDGASIYAPNLDGKLYAFNPSSTRKNGILWTYDQEGTSDSILSSPAVVSGKILVGSDSGIITLLDKGGSRLRRLGNTDDKVRAPITTWENTVYVRSLEELITAYIVTGNNLEVDWEFQIEGF